MVFYVKFIGKVTLWISNFGYLFLSPLNQPVNGSISTSKKLPSGWHDFPDYGRPPHKQMGWWDNARFTVHANLAALDLCSFFLRSFIISIHKSIFSSFALHAIIIYDYVTSETLMLEKKFNDLVSNITSPTLFDSPLIRSELFPSTDRNLDLSTLGVRSIKFLILPSVSAEMGLRFIFSRMPKYSALSAKVNYIHCRISILIEDYWDARISLENKRTIFGFQENEKFSTNPVLKLSQLKLLAPGNSYVTLNLLKKTLKNTQLLN
jgi:hypothetical protein